MVSLLDDHKTISYEEGMRLAEELHASYVECSAKYDYKRVHHVLETMVWRWHEFGRQKRHTKVWMGVPFNRLMVADGIIMIITVVHQKLQCVDACRDYCERFPFNARSAPHIGYISQARRAS